MRQITKRQLDRQGSKANIQAWAPFELVIDGEVVAVVLPKNVGSQASKAKHSDSQAKELRFSKARQASGSLTK